ncbi:MAG: hypothetical protein FP814_01335, partial [Desulfobacterium sp.]|nr:hypothetical protein [Desulfobacterium sp.]MBU4035233.1 hypothetical protein [Pseudomonadota bacterium]
DKDVESAVKKFYYKLSDSDRLFKIQEWLYLHGYEVVLTGQLDNATVSALKQFDSSYNPANKIDADIFLKIYASIPIKESTLGRRNQLDRIMGQAPQAVEASSVPAQQPPMQQAAQAAAPQQSAPVAAQAAPQPAAAPAVSKQQRAVAAPAPAAASSVRKKSAIGRILTDEEW